MKGKLFLSALLSAARLWLWAALAVVATAGVAAADAFPTRPMHLIMPYSPGGIVDFAGRVLAQKLGDVLGQTVVA